MSLLVPWPHSMLGFSGLTIDFRYNIGEQSVALRTLLTGLQQPVSMRVQSQVWDIANFAIIHLKAAVNVPTLALVVPKHSTIINSSKPRGLEYPRLPS